MLSSTLYTVFSILWYSLCGLFIKPHKLFAIGDTQVTQLSNGSKKAIIVFHGISGTGNSGYIQYMAKKLKGLYDIYSPNYGSEKHLYAAYLPVENDPVFMRDVLELYKQVSKNYDQISFVAFSAGGPCALSTLKLLKDEDIKILNSTFFVSPAFKLESGFKHLEDVLFLARWIMKFDFWSKHFSRVKNEKGFWTAIKFWFSCHTFEDVFTYFVKNPVYPILSADPIFELNTKFVLLHPDNDPIVQCSETLDYMQFKSFTRINQLKGGHIGFTALDRCVKFYKDNENVTVQDSWDPTQLIKD